MDISADVAAIVGQASDWNFAGDCALLELMKRISQNLHERGEQTSRNFREFETKVRRVDIALDNATNSLRSLQFGQQFVEYRVEEVDDDDFVLPEEQQKKPELPLKSSQELAADFLQNNLQMFRKNFEAVTIELTDSDEEDGTVNATTVYRAKNPYDSIPLPYVIGSKEWQEHKYAGLYDSTENSEDEQPEQFSSSSSDELETAAPKATPVHQAQHSDSSSLASLPKEMPAQNQATPAARPVPQPGAQTVPQTVPQPVPQPRPIISMHRNPHESDMFAALRASPPSDDPPSSSASSLNSSPAVSHANAAATGLSSSSSSASKVVIQAGRQSPPKLFDEAVPVVPAATPIDVPSAVKPTPAAASQIKRKPVNLFNDDEFNSFMSEIVEKVQSKSGNGSTPPATVAKSKNTPKESPAPQEVKPVAPPRKPIETPQRSLNLFEDSPPLSPNLRPATSTANPAKTLPTSLFDDNLDDDVDDFLSSFTAKAKPQQQKPKTTLFDDDDDLDIDDIFAKKTPTVQPTKLASKIVSKSSLFDDDVDDVENAHDIFGTSSIKAAEKQPQQTKVAPVLPPAREPPGAPRSLFDDLGDDDLFGTPKTKKPSPYAGAEKKQLSETKRLVKEAPPADVAPANQVVEQQLPEQAEHIGDQAKKLEQQIPQASQDLPDEAPAILKAQLPISKVDLFSEDFSDEEAVVSSSSHTTRDLKEITTTGELLPEPTNKAKEDQVEPENKDKVELVSNNEEQHQVKPALLGDLLKNIKDSSATTIAEEDEMEEEEPPADQQQQDPIISLVAEQTKNSTHSHAPADVAAAQQIMQNYSSLFSDEPPDDSEFFQSLGTSSLSSLSATKMFDSEQDFYEPSLPDLPPAAAATVEQPNNDYGGMRLFSDEPPDDDEDEEDEKEKAPAAAKQPDAAAPKRIHTIFYDDFSETTRAGAVQQAKSAIFAEEPPPADAVEPKPGSPIKKLQMPNININVQALLPGSGALPKPPKKLKEAVAPSAAPVSKVAISSSSEADNILQCISKTRVRGPAHRRPSTRRARQANYAKSLLEAQPEPIPASSTSPSAATSTTASLSSKSAGVPSFESDDNEEDDALFKAFRAHAAAPQESSQAATSKPALFLDCDADDDALFDKTLARKAEKMPAATAPVASPATASVAPPAAASVTAPPGDSPIASPAIAPVAPPTTPAVAMLSSTQPPEDDLKPFAKSASFLDSDEDDDDSNSFLFSPSATQTPAQYANRGTSRAPAGPPKSYVSFLDNNDEDEDAMFAAAATRSAATAAAVPTVMPSQKPAKDGLKSTAKSAFLDSDDDDDNDALFQPSKLKTQPQLVEPKSSKVLAPAPASVALDKSKPKPVKSKLFDDSDDDDDDLFGSAVASVTKAQPAATPAAAATLFASSSEEESEQKPPKPLATKAKLPTKPAKSLFSDDDDDDDLFGGGAAPGAKRAAASRQAKPVPKKAASKTTTATPLQASKTDGADNPLADLLGP